jgi:4-amino-4-deoxy-L-arabinose transferase-like glycosyltransferase
VLLLVDRLWAVIYMTGISRPALLDDVDTVHAEAAREMLQRHDWVTLYTNGFRYLEKAPLLYWSLAASYKIFGVSDWSTRLPLMLGVLALLLATYRLGRYVYGESGGLYAGVVLVTSLGLFIFTRFLIPEVLVALWLTLGYYFFLRSLEEENPSRFACWGFAAMCALNVLTKGLIGLVFPAGAIGLYLLLTGNLRRLLRLRVVSSTIVFLAIAAPWHILAALRNPAQGQARGFLWFYFINEHVMRFLGKRVPPGYDTVPLAISGDSCWRGSCPGAYSCRKLCVSFPLDCGSFAASSVQKWIGNLARIYSSVYGRSSLLASSASPRARSTTPFQHCRARRYWWVGGWRVNPQRRRASPIGGREEFLRLSCWFSACWVRGRHISFLCFPSPGSRRGPGGSAQEESRGL